jgi:hypothetical protein
MIGSQFEADDEAEGGIRLLTFGLTLSACFLTAACSDRPTHFTPPNRADPILEVSEIKLESSDKIIADMNNGDTPNARKRNSVQFRLIAQSDIYCGDFISSIYGRRAVTNVWYSTITTATAAAAAIVGGRAAQNLAGASAVANEMRGSINNEMYGGEIIPTVAKEIVTMRRAALAQILPKQNKTIEEYSGTAALADAIGYHELCSIPMAMSSILARANSKATDTKADLTGSVKAIDDAIATEKARLTDKDNLPDAAGKARIKNNISDLSDRRSDLIRIYTIPSIQSETPVDSKQIQ